MRKKCLSSHRKRDRAGLGVGSVNKVKAWAELQEILGIPGFPQRLGQGEGRSGWVGVYTTAILFRAESSPLYHRNVLSGETPSLFHSVANAQGNYSRCLSICRTRSTSVAKTAAGFQAVC